MSLNVRYQHVPAKGAVLLEIWCSPASVWIFSSTWQLGSWKDVHLDNWAWHSGKLIYMVYFVAVHVLLIFAFHSQCLLFPIHTFVLMTLCEYPIPHSLPDINITTPPTLSHTYDQIIS